jgi:hypothetical protein
MKNMMMKKLTVLAVIAALIAALGGGCGNPAGDGGAGGESLSSANAITGFGFDDPEAEGTIDADALTVIITVPYSTDVTGLTPAITHTGVGISPGSGEAQNFTTPVTYTVTAEDGSDAAWKVMIKKDIGPVIADIIEAAQEGDSSAGNSVTNPISLSLDIDFSIPGVWADILTAIQSADKYVDLDLSACIMSGGTEFDPQPGTSNAGESQIVSLVLPEAATSIKAGTSSSNATFKNFTALKSVVGGAVTNVGDYAFSYCTALETVSLPVAISIDTLAFAYCNALETVNTLPMVTTIGSSAFLNCITLETVSLPAATNIGEDAFSVCYALEMVNIPMVTTIGSNAFFYCTALTTVNIPAVTSIAGNPFNGCINLTAITVAADNPNYQADGGKLLSKDGKTLIAWPAAKDEITLDGITTIGPSAFSRCTALETVNLLAAQTISRYAFSFIGTGPLTIVLGDTPPELGTQMFYGVGTKSVTIKVPSGVGTWTGKTGTFTGAENTTGGPHWGEGFRGKGWTSDGAYPASPGTVNENITLTIQAAP